MAIKPSPTIAGKLRKLFSNNKQTIEPAIGDSIPGGSGGGANVLTLYFGEKDGSPWAYKNSECTEEYTSYEEAKSAVKNSDIIEVCFSDIIIAEVNVGYAIGKYAEDTPFGGKNVGVAIFTDELVNVSLYRDEGPVGPGEH